MAGIIKAGKSTSSGPSVVHSTYNFDDMAQKAEAYLDSVREQAARLLADAEAEAERIRRTAEEEGQQTAMVAAQATLKSEVDQRMQSVLPAIDQAVRQLQQARVQWQQPWETNVVRLATAIAEKLIRRELRNDPQISQEWIRESLQLASAANKLTLRLHPQDHGILQEQIGKLQEQFGKVAPTEVLVDPSVGPGGCRVDTEHGWVDMQLTAQLQRLEEELAGQEDTVE